MNRIYKILYITQEKQIGDSKYRRINPYNPLSYVIISCVFITGLFLYGVLGIWEEFDFKNTFRWN